MTHEAEVKRGLDNVKADKENNIAVNEARKFYKNNQFICDLSYKYYNGYFDHRNEYLREIVRITVDQVKKEYPDECYLLLTANEIEEGVLLRFFAEKYKTKWLTYQLDTSTGADIYHILIQNGKTIVHCAAGRSGDDHTRRAINRAAKIFSIKNLFLLGVCYGIYPREQPIGNVIVSNEISGYRINFRDNEKGDVIFEPEIEFNKSPDFMLDSQVHGIVNSCQPRNVLFEKWGGNHRISWRQGKFLSANCLMSSKVVKDSIIRCIGAIRPKAYGGEMEACGIFKSYLFEEMGFRKWLVIKGICDWGEKKNSLFPGKPEEEDKVKNSFQSLAMLNACYAFDTLLSHGAF